MKVKDFMSKVSVRKVWKKKSFWFSVIAIVLIIVLGVVFFSTIRKKKRIKRAMASSVQTTTVTLGTVCNTVEGSGSLEAAETIEVKTFSGLKIKSINVESGDTVKKGQKLATLDKVSIIKELVDIQKYLEEIDEELDSDELSVLETEALKNEKSELKRVERKLKELRSDPVIKAKTAGIVGEVSIYENSEVSKGSTSSSSTNSVQLTGRANSDSGLSMTMLSIGGANTAVITESVEVANTTMPENTPKVETDKVDNTKKSTAKNYGNKQKNKTNAIENSAVSTKSNQTTSTVIENSDTNRSTASTSSEIYSVEEISIMTIYKKNKVKVIVSIDELDILDVKKGQNASITLDALEDEEFEGRISKVSSSATAGNGSTKYKVEITIPMSENMRIGMSAAATIKISEVENVLTLPMTALQQKGDETFVYTSQDSDGNLSGEVVVETGLSDGETVEITGELEAGSTVYYMRKGDSESDSLSFPGDGRIPDGGMMPGGDGGSMPNRDDRGAGGGFPGGGEQPSMNR